MTVHEIKRTSLLDVPAKLRELAAHVEKNEIKTAVVILGHPGGYITVRAFGEQTTALSTIGWLGRAFTFMTQDAHLADSDEYGTPPDDAS